MNALKRYRRSILIGACVVLLSAVSGRSARAWGPEGHQTVAALADHLLKGTNAAAQASALLGGVSLEDAAVWADCAKGVNPTTFIYEKAGTHPECAPFENPQDEAAMIDFVKRNATNCNPKPTEETCHKQYHYSDVAIQHDHYSATFAGARIDDITVSVSAAVAVLQDATAPAPYSIKDKREALLLLVHYVGDIHQPLHVGAVYLDAAGKRVNPKKGQIDPATETRGGNEITVDGSSANLHATWDAIPPKLNKDQIKPAWLKELKSIPATSGPVAKWSVAWASDTQKQAVKAFQPLKFGPKSGTKWSTKLPAHYETSMTPIKKAQLNKAGARLAKLLTAIWPESAVSTASNK